MAGKAKDETKKGKGRFKKIFKFKFFKDIFLELKKVTWPGRSQVFKNTLSVFVYCIVLGAAIWSVDYLLQEFVKAILPK